MMAENFPEIMKKDNPQIQESQRILSKTNKEGAYLVTS